MIVAETDRLLLRRLRPTDASALERVLCDPAVMRFSDGVQTSEQVRRWIRDYVETHYAQWGFGMWALALKTTRATIGYCGLSRFPDRCQDGEAEIGVRLARNQWGRGYATEALRAVHHLAIETLMVNRLIAFVDPANASSVRLVEKLGMRFEREIMFEWYDHPDHLYALQA